VRDAYSLSYDDCRESCCLDMACDVYQFAEPVDIFASFGVSCWRGRQTACDGPAHDGVLGGLAGRRTSYAQQVANGQPRWTGQLGNGSGALGSVALANSAPTRLGADGADTIAYAVSGAVISCLLGGGAALALRRRRLSARRVIPVTKASGSFRSVEAAPDPAGASRNGALGTRGVRAVDVSGSRRARLLPTVARGRRVMPVVGRDAADATDTADAVAQQREQARRERMHALWKLAAAARRAEEERTHAAAQSLRNRISARVIQRRFREHVNWRDMVALTRHYAAVRIQVHARDRLSHRHQTVRMIQQMAGVRLKEWSSQREEAHRLMSELSVLLETTREKAAESTFAPRRDAEGRDIDEASDEESDHPMEDFLDELRRDVGRDVGLPAPTPIHAEAQRAETPPLPTCRAYKEATPSVRGW